MKKTLLIAILVLAAGWLSGCSFAYEEYRTCRRPHRVVVAPPPVKVVEVVHVPPRHPRPRPRRHRHW
ncbi:MAG: hypothetical protein JSW27_23730 [Phycisphaerales bacterium]|nr:MAG: hypothetical protein JSW27_23730 [Phycisphaerales bacterium]